VRGYLVKAGAGAAAAAKINQHRRDIRVNPRNAQAHALLGLALLELGQLEEAVASQRRALELAPTLTGLHTVMAPTLQVLGQHEAAVDSYRRALSVQPENADMHRGLSDSLRVLAQFEAAGASARQAVALRPDNPDNHLTLAAALYVVRDYEAAAGSLRQVLELSPDHAGARRDLGVGLQQLRQYEPAAACYRLLLELRPDDAQAHIGLGACLRELKQFDAAVASYQRALEMAPDERVALHDLGLSLHLQGQLEPARAAFERTLAAYPGDALVLVSLAIVFFELGQWEQALQHARRAVEAAPDSAPAHSTLLFLLSHSSTDAAQLTAEHRKFGAYWDAKHQAQRAPHSNQRDPGRVLRIGFVSADLYSHAVTQFIEPIFAILQGSAQLTLHVYYNNVVEDAVTQRLRGYVGHWHSIAALDDDAAERRIRADGIDILIDLSGHSARNRLPLFARKPAPVQASWIGYAGTTGLQAMDYYLSDQYHLPEGRYDEQFSEKIVRLPLSAPFLPEPTAPPVNPLPALSNGYVTFGSFHRTNKLSRAVIALWAQLLRDVPNSRMLLGGLSAGADSALLGWFDEEGIDRSRLILRERTSLREYLAQHHEVDVCLSPFPYTGSTTICHALWMGVPTLTTIGPTNPSHAVVCYLAHLGLSSFIANDAANYTQLGVFLSENLPMLATLRGSMRERFTSSVVGYPGVAAAGLEHALRLMWERWCADLPPASFRVRLADLMDEPEPEPNP
jgi:predicted O-linked N-acetylglucosamine transferase (SPINDLY family)